MSELQIIALGIVQGLSEFLPISSSGHLILVPILTGWPDQGLLVDVAVHVGSLGAVLLYFRRDLWCMLRGLGDWRAGRPLEQQGRHMIALITVGTVPIIIAGFALKSIGTDALRSAAVVGCTSIVFGTLLFIADGFGQRRRTIADMSFTDALIIGGAQALALIPGTSRSGVTMTAARLLGLHRPEAARFSFLLSIPAILAAGALVALDLVRLGESGVSGHVMVGVLAAFVSAWAAIAFLMRWLQRSTFTPFVVYRWALGLVLLSMAFGILLGLTLALLGALFVYLATRQPNWHRQERAISAGSAR
jgi:undecaprenyl-diphosphatase